MLGRMLAMLGLPEPYIGSCWAAVKPLQSRGRPYVGHVGPSLLINSPVLDYVGLMPKRGWEAPFWGAFSGAPSGVQTPSEAGYPSTFYEEFNDPVWVPFRGASAALN